MRIGLHPISGSMPGIHSDISASPAPSTAPASSASNNAVQADARRGRRDLPGPRWRVALPPTGWIADSPGRCPPTACARRASASRRRRRHSSRWTSCLVTGVHSDTPQRAGVHTRPTASRARLAVDFTVPRLMPVASAISASDSPP